MTEGPVLDSAKRTRRRRNLVVATVAASLLVATTGVIIFRTGKAGTYCRSGGTAQIIVAETAPQAQIDATRQKLSSSKWARDVEFHTKEQALARARRIFEDKPEVIDELGSNPFPASFGLELANGATMKDIRDIVKGDPSVSEIEGSVAKSWRC